MTRDIVNAIPSPSAAPLPAAVGAQSRGKGFESLIPAENEDDEPSRRDETSKAPDTGLAALLGIPQLFAPAAIALDVARTEATVIAGVEGCAPLTLAAAAPDATSIGLPAPASVSGGLPAPVPASIAASAPVVVEDETLLAPVSAGGNAASAPVGDQADASSVPVAADPRQKTPALIPDAATEAVSASDPTGPQAAESEKPEATSRVSDGRTPVATLAAALQAQTDGFFAGRAEGQSANDALAAAGVVRLNAEASPGEQALGSPVKQVGAVEIGIAGATDGKAVGGKPDGGKAEAANKDTLLVDGAAVTQAADLAAEIPQTTEARGASADVRPEAIRAPTDRIQTLQTSAAPATPSAQTGMSGTVAAAVQVANEIASHASARRTRFEVRLDPGDLGRVDVRLDIASDGRVATRLIVERPETLDLLRNDARELSRTLEQAGFQLGQGGLAFQLKHGRQQPSADEAGSGRKAAADDIDVAVPVVDAYSRSRSAGAGGVDVKV